jgi:hypothetical protein
MLKIKFKNLKDIKTFMIGRTNDVIKLPPFDLRSREIDLFIECIMIYQELNRRNIKIEEE